MAGPADVVDLASPSMPLRTTSRESYLPPCRAWSWQTTPAAARLIRIVVAPRSRPILAVRRSRTECVGGEVFWRILPGAGNSVARGSEWDPESEEPGRPPVEVSQQAHQRWNGDHPDDRSVK